MKVVVHWHCPICRNDVEQPSDTEAVFVPICPTCAWPDVATAITEWIDEKRRVT